MLRRWPLPFGISLVLSRVDSTKQVLSGRGKRYWSINVEEGKLYAASCGEFGYHPYRDESFQEDSRFQ
jgi:hypothetical protein